MNAGSVQGVSLLDLLEEGRSFHERAAIDRTIEIVESVFNQKAELRIRDGLGEWAYVAIKHPSFGVIVFTSPTHEPESGCQILLEKECGLKELASLLRELVAEDLQMINSTTGQHF